MKKSFIIIIIFCLYSSLSAQSYSDVAISGARNMTFPSLLPGISSTLATTSTSAGRYLITMNKNMTLAVTFTLPTYLTTTGGAQLPITFTATKSQSSTDATLGTSFNPYSGTTVQRVSSSKNKWYIRVGGTIPTPSTQTAGSYSGTIVMIITITGA